MWHFLHLKKTNFGYGKHIVLLQDSLSTGECGNRDTNTLKKLLQRLKKWNVKTYITDNWKSYNEMIPEEMLLQSKKYTHPIERNNFRQRHWFARFRRKTCVVSRSLQMVDLTMALFAKFHCNSTFSFPSLFT